MTVFTIKDGRLHERYPTKSYATDMNSCKPPVSYVGTVTCHVCLPTGHFNTNTLESPLLTMKQLLRGAYC